MRKNAMWKLFLDDVRNPTEDGFTTARSSAQAIFFVRYAGLPTFISFDHDLGQEDDAMRFIDFMIEEYYDEDVPDYQVHSANPVGRDNIVAKMESWKRSQGL